MGGECRLLALFSNKSDRLTWLEFYCGVFRHVTACWERPDEKYMPTERNINVASKGEKGKQKK